MSEAIASDNYQYKDQQEEQRQALTAEDWEDSYLAHQYRLSLPSSPSQSNFRVIALLFYKELIDGGKDSQTTSHLPPWIKQMVGHRTFIVGTNDEPGYMGGSICAERAAMVQLRFVPAFKLTKVVIATDCETMPISPGMLCREFLAGHGESVPWDLKVISTGSMCLRCKKKDAEIFRKLPRARTTKESQTEEGRTYCCINGHHDHSLVALRTTIADLYAYPSPYTRFLTAPQSVELGTKYSESPYSTRDLYSLDDTSKRLLELAIEKAKQSATKEAGHENHPIHFGAAVIFENQCISTSHQCSALEYGCSLDAISQLAPCIQDETCDPALIVQADQYGVVHAPFAPARAFLSEHGYNKCRVLVHHTALDDATCLDRWNLKNVSVSEIAPTPPVWASTCKI